MPEPIIRAFCHLPSHISNSTVCTFNTTCEFSFTLQLSLIKTREHPWVKTIEAFTSWVGGSLVHRAYRILHEHGGRVCTCLDSYQYGDYSRFMHHLRYSNCTTINSGIYLILSWLAWDPP